MVRTDGCPDFRAECSHLTHFSSRTCAFVSTITDSRRRDSTPIFSLGKVYTHISMVLYASQTYATTLTFLMAMALNPDKQRLAQEEIDKVLGGDRLPTVNDRPSLPYIAALIKEVMRWNPAVPLGECRPACQARKALTCFLRAGPSYVSR